MFRYTSMSERITIYPNWSEAERRDRLYVGLSRFAVSELCGFYVFRFLDFSLSDPQGHPQHACGMFSYQVPVAVLTDCDGSKLLVAPHVQTAGGDLTCLGFVASTPRRLTEFDTS